MIQGLKIVENWISPEEEALYLEAIRNGVWERSLKRRVQQFGPIYNYGTKILDAEQKPLPSWMENSFQRLVEPFGRRPEQVIVNEYKVGQGISRHIDSPRFGPVIASLSLLSDATMEMGIYNGEKMMIPLPRRSIAIMEKDARNKWYHAISNVPAERISITFRTVN